MATNLPQRFINNGMNNVLSRAFFKTASQH